MMFSQNACELVKMPSKKRPTPCRKRSTESKKMEQSVKNVKNKKYCVQNVGEKLLKSPVKNSKAVVTQTKLLQNDMLQLPSSNHFHVDELMVDAHFPGLSDMEDDAFQLAKYVETNQPYQNIVTETIQNESANANDTKPDPHESTEMNSTEKFELSLKELQMFNENVESKIAGVNKTQNQVGEGNVDSVGCYKTCQFDGKDGIDQIGQSFYLKRKAPSIFNSSGNYLKQKRLPGSASFWGYGTRKSSSTANYQAGNHSNRSIRSQMTGYSPVTTNVTLKRQKGILFNGTCYKYLNGQTCGTVCKWNHVLPPADEILPKLMRLCDDTVRYIYFDFVLRSYKSFVTYFPAMCEVFGRKQMITNLLNAISDCEIRQNAAFLKHIFNGLVMSGLTKRAAFIELTENCNKSRDAYDVFLEIIIETDPSSFIDMLKTYSLLATISISSLRQLLQHVIDFPSGPLLTVFIDILDRYSLCNVLDVETLHFIIPRVQQLTLGNLILSQKVNHITHRMC